MLLPTCALTFSLVGMTVNPVAAQVGTYSSITSHKAHFSYNY